MKFLILVMGVLSFTSSFAAPQIQYLVNTVDKSTICIDADTQSSSYYDSFRFFMKKMGHKKTQIQVLRVTRMRDGGTTTIQLNDGTVFFSPSVFRKDLTATYNQAVVASAAKTIQSCDQL